MVRMLRRCGAVTGYKAYVVGVAAEEIIHVFLCSQVVDIARTELGSHDKNGQIGGRNLLGVVKHLDALHLVFFGIHHAQHTLVAAADEIAHHCTAGFVHIVGTSDYYNAIGG